tara:strand:- start:776 stop:1081 length:306 start_codon:yes stop_codon:yes gene_type:complete
MATITIYAQYYENYSDTKTPYWKPKGGQTFEIENVNGDTLMYCDNLKEHLTNLIAAQSNEHVKFEYREHEVDFIGKDMSITADMLESEIQSKEYRGAIDLW